ncbi:MAG: 3'(2'),5'-bisphosphate nucleotidase [Phycisphaerales bacterium JB039]
MINPADLLAPALEAVAAAGKVCRAVQQDLDRVRSVTKDDRSPVTVADFASQAIVAHMLHMRVAGMRLVGEEDAAALRAPEAESLREETLSAVRRLWPDVLMDTMLDAIDLGNAEPGGMFWTLDPIDGTKGFLRGQQYAVSLALIDEGRPVVGVMACPNLPADENAPLDAADPDGTLHLAVRGSGAWEITGLDPSGERRRIRASDRAPGSPVRSCASVEKAHTSLSDVDRVLERVGGAGEPARLDSQCKYAVVARGQADAYLRLPTKKGYVERIWDHAAGSLVATEAGAVVTDIAGAELDFARGLGLEANRGIVCAAPWVHGSLIEAIEALGIGRS